MRFLKLMLATALVLDAALILTTGVNLSSDPLTAVGFSTDGNSTSVLVASQH